MSIRTDLALESREIHGSGNSLPGVSSRMREKNGFRITEVNVLDNQGAAALDKPVGKYVTVELGKLLRREDDAFRSGAHVLSSVITEMLPTGWGCVLIAGLGNPVMTPDSLGPAVLRSVMVTRHLLGRYPEQFCSFRSVCAIEPGVLGTTGMESAAVIKAVSDKLHPAAVIAVDALASRKMNRVCKTVQISDTGITPGSGVGNSRKEISTAVLGVPVIAVGVPTVVDAATLSVDAAEESGAGKLDEKALRAHCGGLIVTPRDIDESIRSIAKLIGYGLNLALHPGLTVEDIDMFLE